MVVEGELINHAQERKPNREAGSRYVDSLLDMSGWDSLEVSITEAQGRLCLDNIGLTLVFETLRTALEQRESERRGLEVCAQVCPELKKYVVIPLCSVPFKIGIGLRFNRASSSDIAQVVNQVVVEFFGLRVWEETETPIDNQGCAMAGHFGCEVSPERWRQKR